jgi:hypothetical protein
MNDKTTPVATVTGLYRGTFAGLEPLTKDTPLTQDEVRRNPVFYELDLGDNPEEANLVIDILYDTLPPQRLQDLIRGTDIPRGMRFWPDWFELPPYREMRDGDGRRVYPRAPGVHTVRFRIGRRKRTGLARDFSPANGGYVSPAFELVIGGE